jgi:hypothetical protein
MDRELWSELLRVIKRAAREIGWHSGQRLPLYANWLIVAMYVWSVAHDRPLSWACRRGSYGFAFRPIRSIAQDCAPPPLRRALTREIVHAYSTCRQTRKEQSMDRELWVSVLRAVSEICSGTGPIILG